MLELGGITAGSPDAAQGGDAVAEVVVSPAGPDGVQRKELGAVRYTDIVLRCGTGMEPPFWTWLSDTLTGKDPQRDGALRVLDFDRKEREAVTFTNALVTEVGFPALDAASRETFHVTVRIAAEHVERGRGSGAAFAAPVGRKQALVSNFSVSLDGLDLKRVSRVGPLTVRPSEVPDLELTLAEGVGEPLVEWHREFVIDGKSSGAKEKSGSISLLDAGVKRTLLQLDLAGVGIFALERAAAAAGRDTLPQLTARMYCEELRLAETPPGDGR